MSENNGNHFRCSIVTFGSRPGFPCFASRPESGMLIRISMSHSLGKLNEFGTAERKNAEVGAVKAGAELHAEVGYECRCGLPC